ESEPRQEEIDVVHKTNDVLPPKSEDSNLDNPLLPLPPPEPPDKEFDFEIDFEKEISVERNLIVNSIEIVIFHLLSLRTTEYRDRVEPTTRIISRRLKISCVGYCPGFQDRHLNIEDSV
nr:hypothetical protein [Tanacetum cinerariifolium]